MGENSAISWCDHTFNPFIGCTRVSPACDGCYAAELMGKEGGRFQRVAWGGPGKGEGERVRTAKSTWAQPRKWNRVAEAAVVAWSKNPFAHDDFPKPPRTFVFCASLADVFDNAVPAEWRRDLFKLIHDTPRLTWLLLTKRPQLIVKLYAEAFGFTAQERQEGLHAHFPRNVLLGTTIEDRKRLANAFALTAAARELRVQRFWSCEPLLEDLGDVQDILPDWVITGGETDQGQHQARPEDPAWYRRLRDQCAAAGVPYHHKQMRREGPIPEDLQIRMRPEVWS